MRDEPSDMAEEMHAEAPAAGLDREWHLSPLTVERIVAGEPAEGPIAEHLAGCDECQTAIEQVRADASALRPPARLREAAAGRTTGAPTNRVAIYGAVVALAAVGLFFALRPGPATVETTPTPDIRIKGGFALEIIARDPAKGAQRTIEQGDTVRPGEQLGFKASAASAGHLLILGVDGKGATYPVYPRGAAPKGAAFGPQAQAAALDSAIEFDASTGSETLVALFCAAPVDYPAVAPRLAKLANQAANHSAATPLPALVDGCEQVVNRLQKTP